MFSGVTQTIRVKQSIMKAMRVRLLHTAQLADGNHIEIGNVPSVFTNFVETTDNSSGDRFPAIGSMFARGLT
jgi:hypothetical protein